MLSKLLTPLLSKHFGSSRYINFKTADQLLMDNEKPLKRTKMINTIGPKTQTAENAGRLIDQGMNVARLNFSHGDHAEHLNQTNAVRQALKSRPDLHASILLDTKGPQIRTGNNEGNQLINLQKGQLLQLTTDYKHLGNSKRIACSYPDLASTCKIGKKILFADGGVSSRIKSIQNGIVTVEILNDGKIGSKKNMCLPGTVINLPTVTKADQYDIVEFGLKHKVNYIALSFARYKSDLDNLRKLLTLKDPEHGKNVHLISKIQNHEAIHNLDEIIDGSDGIMIARGDLGMEVPLEKVVVLQKYIMHRTIAAGKYVITATQMLQSMQTKPRPTRAQVSDITNAVTDLTDACMTSGQTTNGQFPFDAASYMNKVSREAQSIVNYRLVFDYKKRFSSDNEALGIVSLSFELNCDFIFLQTDSIKLINRISSLRPKAYLIIFNDNPHIKLLTALNFGVYCFPKKYESNTEQFLLTHGVQFHVTKARTLHISTNSNGQIRTLNYDIS